MTDHTGDANDNNNTNGGNPADQTKPTMTLTGPAEIAAAVAHVLGFVPSNSLIVLGVGPKMPSSRVDFPQRPAEVIEVVQMLGEVYTRHATPGVETVLVAWTNDTHAARELLPAIAAILADVAPVAAAVQIHDGDQPAEAWTEHSDVLTEHPDLIGPWPTGPITTADRDRIDVQMIGHRPTPDASRAARASRLEVDPEASETTHEAIAHHTAGHTDDGQGIEAQVRAIRQVVEADQPAGPLPVETVARLLIAVNHRPTREHLVTTIRRSNAAAHHEVWTQAARRAPATHRQGPLLLVALTAWLTGDGATGWIAIDALDALAGGRETDVLAQVVTVALTAAHHPDTWERSINPDR